MKTVNNIKIDFRTKQISDEELTLKFLYTVNKCYEYIRQNELFAYTLNGNKYNREIKSYKLHPKKTRSGYKQPYLYHSEDKGKTWVELPKGNRSYRTHIGYFDITYTRRDTHSYHVHPLVTTCKTIINFDYNHLSNKKLDNILNGTALIGNVDQYDIYLKFIKALSKNNRKKLINHIYYFDNPIKSEYKRYKKFINEYLCNSLTIKIDGKELHSIGYFKTFQEIRNQRIDQLLKNKSEDLSEKLKDEDSTLCQRLTGWLKSKKTVSN
ncbi:MAG: hypothetical protein SLAVMIC_00822 [uncultured marine phage]|uniref:Uncharacterized protein n=1 Tax=uncultured marine phage TaxID=707152 RepID=A0A8D9FRE6_9VIRU|nr:MAG: hypothetical protein SLAVMIC_00822 [uncultured marine phage]